MLQTTTAPEIIMLATANIEKYARYSRSAWEKFCSARGYSFFHYPDKLIDDMHVNWSKIEMARQHLASSSADIVVLVDADTYVCNPRLDLNELADRYPDKHLMFSRDCRNVGPLLLPLNYEAAFRYKTRKLPNAGFIVVRNTEFSRRFFDKWIDLARNDLRDIADTHPRNQRVLWEGLYFQNKDQIVLLDKEVERIRDVGHLPRAIRQGAAVVHVKDGLNQNQAKDLANYIDGLT